MNSPHPTLDLHPDADSLNGFVEQVLPEGERQQVLAHIAACNRCRQVIFLAQEAAASMVEAPAPVAHPSPPSPSRTPAWLTNWRLLWIPLAACAAILALAVFLPGKRETPTSQIAKVETFPNPPIANPPSPLGSSPELETVHPSSAKLTAKIAHLSPVRTPHSALPAQTPSESTVDGVIVTNSMAVDTPSPPPSASSTAADQTLVAGNQFANRSVAGESATELKKRSRIGSQKSALAVMAKPSPQPPATALPNTQTPAPNSGNSEVAAAPLTPATASRSYSAEAAATTQSHHTYRTTSQGGPTLNLSASSVSALPASSDSDYARMALYTKLPNGLTAISTAAAQHRLLAIDSAGALFLSNDFGKSWEPIAQQWTSKALQVRVNQTSSPSPTAVFEIVTGDGSIWTSQDGKTWQAK